LDKGTLLEATEVISQEAINCYSL